MGPILNKDETKLKQKVVNPFFYNKKDNPYTLTHSEKEYSLIEISGKKASKEEKEKLLNDLTKNGFFIPNGSLPCKTVSTLVSELLTIYNLDSTDDNKKQRAQRTYDEWRKKFNHYRDGLNFLKKNKVDPNCFYYKEYEKAKIFTDFLLTKGMNLVGNVVSVKKAGKINIEKAKEKEKSMVEITKPYVESLNWKTEILTRLTSSILVGGTIIIAAQQEAIQKFSDILPGLGHVAYIGAIVLSMGFFSISKHFIRFLALSARKKANLNVLKEVMKADASEIKSGETKAAIFKLSVMELMANLGYWKELEQSINICYEPILYKAIQEKNSLLFVSEISNAKSVLLNRPFILRRWFDSKYKRAKKVAGHALNSARELDGIGLLVHPTSEYIEIVDNITKEASHEVF